MKSFNGWGGLHPTRFRPTNKINNIKVKNGSGFDRTVPFTPINPIKPSNKIIVKSLFSTNNAKPSEVGNVVLKNTKMHHNLISTIAPKQDEAQEQEKETTINTSASVGSPHKGSSMIENIYSSFKEFMNSARQFVNNTATMVQHFTSKIIYSAPQIYEPIPN